MTSPLTLFCHETASVFNHMSCRLTYLFFYSAKYPQDTSLVRKEIVRAIRTAPILHHKPGVTVVRVYQATALKYGPGPDVHLPEARTMRLVFETTCVRLPTVFDA